MSAALTGNPKLPAYDLFSQFVLAAGGTCNPFTAAHGSR